MLVDKAKERNSYKMGVVIRKGGRIVIKKVNMKRK
jgi:hypothetical protein